MGRSPVWRRKYLRKFVGSPKPSSASIAAAGRIDLFRVEDGLLVEHWDVSEEIPPEETWVNSGKF